MLITKAICAALDQLHGIDAVGVGNLADDLIDHQPESLEIVGRSDRRCDPEAEFAEPFGDDDAGGLVAVGQREEHRARRAATAFPAAVSAL